MTPEIRNVRVEEFEPFMRHLEQAFGHSKAFFQRAYPHLYLPTEEALAWAYVIEEDGEIVSHVGLYPIETVTAGVRMTVGGIGAVSTAPRARGKGYMSQLLNHIVDEMRGIGYPVSWLGGDRQRYNTFGWEMASPVYDLHFSGRSLTWHGIAPTEIEEVLPEEALATVERFSNVPECHTIRPDLAHQIHRMDNRFFINDDGYAILQGQARDHIRIAELVSVSGNEVGWIRALLEWNFGSQATWSLSMWDRTRLGRLMLYVSAWMGGYPHMYRVNDLTQTLTLAKAALVERAATLRNFAVALGMREHDRTTVTTLTVEDGDIDIYAGNHAAPYVELSAVEAARLLFGGPPLAPEVPIPPGLQALLPVPCFVLPFDHV
ncbi:MAG: GNAT family N-acetyltransferase [Anaerolineae bacterium]|nr:GNAT family N-acetyltransferase [Anaerolineae bacterium]